LLRQLLSKKGLKNFIKDVINKNLATIGCILYRGPTIVLRKIIIQK